MHFVEETSWRVLVVIAALGVLALLALVGIDYHMAEDAWLAVSGLILMAIVAFDVVVRAAKKS